MHDADLRANAQTILRRLGPLSPSDLARHLVAAGHEGVDPHDLSDLLLDEWGEDGEPVEGFVGFPLLDGRLCDLDHLLDGLVLTHRITEEERAADAVAITHLLPLTWVSGDGRRLELTDGGHLQLTIDALVGPAGWLPDSPLLVLTIRDGAVELGGADVVPAPDPTLVERLRATYDASVTPEPRIETPELLVEVRARYPEAFAAPQAPLSELLAAADLRLFDDAFVLPVDAPDPDPPEFARRAEMETHLRHHHGLDDRSVVAFLELEGVVLRASNELLRRGLDDDASGSDDIAETLDEALGDADLRLAARDALTRLFGDTRWSLAVLHDLVGSDHLAAAVLLTLIEREPVDLPRRDRANRQWLRARLLEFVADDHSRLEPELRRVLELDPHHGEAAFDLARYRADAGQAGAALGYLRQLDHTGGDGAWVELLERYAAPGPVSAERNDPCPCGSGRKHKVCCAVRNGWPLDERIGWLHDKIARHAASAPAADLLEPVYEALGVELDDPSAWDDLVIANLSVFDSGVVRDLVGRRGALLPADELDLLRDWAEVRAGAYGVVEVDRGTGVTLRDHRAGTTVELADRSLSEHLQVDDMILAWIVPGPDGPEAVTGVVPVPSHARVSLLELIDSDPYPEEVAAWYGALSGPPTVTNREGEPLVFGTVTYEVADEAEAQSVLASRLDEEDGVFVEHHTTLDGDSVVRGTVTLDGATLIVEANSSPRTARLRDLVEGLLPDARLVDEQHVPVAEAMARSRTDGDADAGYDEDVSPEEAAALQAALDEYLTAYEDRWLDLPIPALGGATPREAADDPTRRGDLERLLREMGARAVSGAGRAMDADRLRELLGLDR